MDESYYRLIAEHALDMICLVKSDLVMMYASPACERILGWKPAEMVGNGPDAFVHPDDLPIIHAAHRLLEEHGEDKMPTVVRMRRKAGDYAWMEINARLVPDSAGLDYIVVLVLRAVTVRQAGAVRTLPEANRRVLDKARPGAPRNAEPHIITGIDMYVTRSGRVAFLDSVRRDEHGRVVYSGYILEGNSGPSPERVLEWAATGECIAGGGEGDHIKQRI